MAHVPHENLFLESQPPYCPFRFDAITLHFQVNDSKKRTMLTFGKNYTRVITRIFFMKLLLLLMFRKIKQRK